MMTSSDPNSLFQLSGMNNECVYLLSTSPMLNTNTHIWEVEWMVEVKAKLVISDCGLFQ